MKFWTRFWLVWLVVAFLVTLPGAALSGRASPLRQEEDAAQKARVMLAKMTPEERVGQLFLVTFQGSTIDDNSQIANLIKQYHIGGIILMRANDNFTSADSIPVQAYNLNRLLQQGEWRAAQDVTGKSATEQAQQYIPLLLGISQEGDQLPNDQILSGLTPLPDQMAIGATWNPQLAEQVGSVMGKELSALGFNLYLGPSLDVLETPQTTSSDDLGVRTFGGSAYWVGKMGQSYISGLHTGSADRLVVVSRNFPGRGSADRAPDEEIATVRKSADQLKSDDLAPFFAVTGNASDPKMVTDGLLVSHIRYQGFQGAIRATTRPISFDSAALDQLVKLPSLAKWRENGGLLISDNLGSPAVRRFYDPTSTAFDARTVAREAFVAGNDLLFVDRFIATNDQDTYTTIARTLDYFAQKYREDAVFAQRVDASVERILTLKYRLYPEFTLEQVTPPEAGLADIGRQQQVTFDVARRSVTLISPDAVDFTNILPRGPETRDRIIFLTDVQTGRQCTTCADTPALAVDTLQAAVIRLYGPRAGGQISQNLMTSYSFAELWKYLNASPQSTDTQPTQFETDLKLANWVVVSAIKPNTTQPETQAFLRLLSDRPQLLRDKKVIAFAFGAPYYLDATDVSKLTAYYGMYSKSAPFIEVAARILFQDLFAAGAGALPVSVSGVGYDLTIATRPDPTQIIPLFIDSPSTSNRLANGTLEPTPAPLFRVGDVFPLRTGVIYDRNHNPVPDGTAVRFVFSVISESTGSNQTQIDTETIDGIARAVYRIDRPGLLEIHAASDEEARSNLLRLDITTGVSAGVTLVAPTPQPTETLVPTPTVTVTAVATPTIPPPIPPTVHFQDWFLALSIALAGAIAIAWFGIRMAIARWGLRWALCGVIGGMLSYNYLALNMPGSQALLGEYGTSGVLLVTITGVLIGWGVGIAWRQISAPRARSAGDRSPRERPATGPKSQSG